MIQFPTRSVPHFYILVPTGGDDPFLVDGHGADVVGVREGGVGFEIPSAGKTFCGAVGGSGPEVVVVVEVKGVDVTFVLDDGVFGVDFGGGGEVGGKGPAADLSVIAGAEDGDWFFF